MVVGTPTNLITRNHVEYEKLPSLSLHRFSSMATSFKKRVSSKPSHPHGTRPSLHNAQLLISSGVPSLDVLLGKGSSPLLVLLYSNIMHVRTCTIIYLCMHAHIGGGLAVGTVLLIGIFNFLL